MQAAIKDQSRAATMTLGGGVLAIVAGVLSWLKLDPVDGPSITFKGTDLSAGGGALALGVVLVIMGILLYTRGKRTGGKGAAVTAIVMAAFILFAGGYSALAPADALAEFESSNVGDALGVSDDVAKAAIKEGIKSEQIDVTALLGAWVATAAGLIGLAGGIVGVRKSAEVKAQTAAASAPPPDPAIPPAAS